jgi:antitoxin HicB
MTTLTKKKTQAKKEIAYKLPLVLTPQPEGGYTVTCPLLPELISEGDTVQKAMANVSDALAALLEAYQHLKRPLPSVLQQTTSDAPVWLEAIVVVN